MIIIQEPKRRTVWFSSNKKAKIPKTKYNLPFPYVVFNLVKERPKNLPLFQFEKDFELPAPYPKLFVGFANSRPRKGTTIYFPPLPNIIPFGYDLYNKYELCLDGMSNDVDPISYFWQSSFMLDFTWVGLKTLNKIIFTQNPGRPSNKEVVRQLQRWESLDLKEAKKVQWDYFGYGASVAFDIFKNFDRRPYR